MSEPAIVHARPVAVTPLRVGFVALGGLGGSGRVACDVARGLAGVGHDVVLLTCPHPQFEDEHGERLRHVPVRAPRRPEPASQWVTDLAEDLALAVRTHGLEVLSVHYGVGLAEAAIMARDRLAAASVPLAVAVTLHGSDVTRLDPSSTDARRLAAAVGRADVVTAVSHHLARQAQRALGLPEAPMVIANGVDLDVFAPGEARAPGWRLCHISNFRPIKRPLDNVEVLSHLRRRDRDAHLTMIGDGPQLAALRQAALDHGVGSHISFVGPLAQPSLAARLRDADLAMVTSERESFGLAGLEAMACGVPIIGTRCGGLEELLQSDGNGSLVDELLVEPGDTRALAERAEALLGTPARYAEVRTRSIALGRSRFGRQRQLDAYATMLDTVRNEVVGP